MLHLIGMLMYNGGDVCTVEGIPRAYRGSKWRNTGFAVVTNLTSAKARGVWDDCEWGLLLDGEDREDKVISGDLRLREW